MLDEVDLPCGPSVFSSVLFVQFAIRSDLSFTCKVAIPNCYDHPYCFALISTRVATYVIRPHNTFP